MSVREESSCTRGAFGCFGNRLWLLWLSAEETLRMARMTGCSDAS